MPYFNNQLFPRHTRKQAAKFIAPVATCRPPAEKAAPGYMTRHQSNQIKHRLRQEGLTLKAWAEAHGFKYRDVSDVLRGQRRGNYGAGRDIYIALGLDPDEQDRLAA